MQNEITYKACLKPHSQKFYFTNSIIIMRKNILFIIAAAVLYSCDFKRSSESNVNDATGTEQTEDSIAQTSFTGTYYGTLPAADCEGIKTELVINADSTYSLTSEYLGKQGEPFLESGVYHLVNNNLIELVTPSSGEKTYYKIKNDSTILLTNSAGEEPGAELLNEYMLRK